MSVGEVGTALPGCPGTAGGIHTAATHTSPCPAYSSSPSQLLLPESSRSPSHNKRNGGLSHLHTLAFAVPSARMPLLRRCCHTSAHPPKNIFEMSVPSKPLTGKTDAASALTALAGTYTCSAPLSLALNTRLMLCLSPVPNTSPQL